MSNCPFKTKSGSLIPLNKVCYVSPLREASPNYKYFAVHISGYHYRSQELSQEEYEPFVKALESSIERSKNYIIYTKVSSNDGAGEGFGNGGHA